MNLVAVGDSITHQAQSLGVDGEPIVDHLTGLGWNVTGWDGYPSQTWLTRAAEVEAALTPTPDVACLLFGTNDAKNYPTSGNHLLDAEDLLWRLAGSIEPFRRAGVPVVVTTIHERGFSTTSNALAPSYNDWLRKRVARLGGSPVAILDWGQLCADAYAAGEVIWDAYLLHPNAEGRARWRAALDGALASLFPA